MAASQRAGASLREGFAFRSGRLAPSAAERQTCGGNGQLIFSLKEGNSASLEALNKAFPSTQKIGEKQTGKNASAA
jgi:hypothetical protein